MDIILQFTVDDEYIFIYYHGYKTAKVTLIEEPLWNPQANSLTSFFHQKD